MSEQPVAHVSAAAPRPLRQFLNPVQVVRSLWSQRELIGQLTKRDIIGRYRNAQLGLLWSLLTPLALLAIYTFVFSAVLQARWTGGEDEGLGIFAIYLFCGMLVFNLFGEVTTRAPMIVAGTPNYVKKVVFPLEALGVSAVLAALFNMAVGFGAWLVFWWFVKWTLPPATALFMPVLIVPVVLTTLGIAWLLASLGVFLPDLYHAVTLIVQMLFFATPVIYRIENLPENVQFVMRLNPLALALEDARGVMIEGHMPHWGWWALSTIASAAIALVGYAFFMKSKKAFADVL